MKTVLVFLILAVFLLSIAYWHLGPHTIYSTGFSSSDWEKIRIGESKEHVLDLIGEPLRAEVYPVERKWIYEVDGDKGTEILHRCDPEYENLVVVNFDPEGLVDHRIYTRDSKPVIRKGFTKEQVRSVLGDHFREILRATTEVAAYAAPGRSGTFFRRTLVFDGTDTVTKKIEEIYWD